MEKKKVRRILCGVVTVLRLVIVFLMIREVLKEDD